MAITPRSGIAAVEGEAAKIADTMTNEVKTIAAELRADGPTIEQYVEAGFSALHYPPAGYSPKSTIVDIQAAIMKEVGLVAKVVKEDFAPQISQDEHVAEADGIVKTAVAPNADGTATLSAAAPPTVPPVNEFSANVDAPEAPAEAVAPAPVMASTGNVGENAKLKDIVLSDLPVVLDAAAVAALKEGALFIAAFLITPDSDKAWHATQIMDTLKSGRSIFLGLSQAYWNYHYKNRPPIAEKKGTSYVLFD